MLWRAGTLALSCLISLPVPTAIAEAGEGINIIARTPEAKAKTQADLIEAIIRFRDIAEAHHLADFADAAIPVKIRVFETQAEFHAYLRSDLGYPEERDIPATVVALYSNSTIYLTEEADALSKDPRNTTHDDFIKIIVHELVHPLHLAAAPEGTGTGPEWFREGLAVFLADQFQKPSLTDEDFLSVVCETSGRDYVKYGAAVSRLAEDFSVREMIDAQSGQQFMLNILMDNGLGLLGCDGS